MSDRRPRGHATNQQEALRCPGTSRTRPKVEGRASAAVTVAHRSYRVVRSRRRAGCSGMRVTYAPQLDLPCYMQRISKPPFRIWAVPALWEGCRVRKGGPSSLPLAPVSRGATEISVNHINPFVPLFPPLLRIDERAFMNHPIGQHAKKASIARSGASASTRSFVG